MSLKKFGFENLVLPLPVFKNDLVSCGNEDEKNDDDEKKEIDVKKRMSVPPKGYSDHDIQVIGKYSFKKESVHISYNNLYIYSKDKDNNKMKKYKYILFNPFLLSYLFNNYRNKTYFIRDLPNHILRIDYIKDIKEKNEKWKRQDEYNYEKDEKMPHNKSNFNYYGINNFFDNLICSDKDKVIVFDKENIYIRDNNYSYFLYETLNPCVCRVQKNLKNNSFYYVYYIIDFKNNKIEELCDNFINIYNITNSKQIFEKIHENKIF